MANSITLIDNWIAVLDEVYQASAKSAGLDTGNNLLKWMAQDKNFKLAKLTMDGLGDYSRSNGYPVGDVSLTWELHAPDYERGRMFTVDEMDDEESARLLLMNLAGEFIRTKVAPELDAVRFASYAALAGTKVSATLAAPADVLAALRTAQTTLDEAEVPSNERYLFITPSLYKPIHDMDTTKSREVLSEFASVVEVPQARFCTAVTLLDGVSTAEKAGGFVKTVAAQDVVAGKNINFEVIHKPAVLQALKHVKPKFISADANQTADAWKYGYRTYGIADVQELKTSGLYLHAKA
ncbi:MAG: hypothetical protein LBU48_05610 [Coriobacteriales bacterium]|jgi:hypothetical protein|nr:hypothetical protein [Coriobacteriales bacterium]